MSHVQAIKSGSIQSAHNRAALNSSTNTTTSASSTQPAAQPSAHDMAPPWRRPRHESMNETTTTGTFQAAPPSRPSVIPRRKHHTSMSEGQSTTRVVPSVVIPAANARSGRITIGSRNRGAGKQTINSAEAEAKSRFYPVVKEARPSAAASNSTLLKRKTRHSTNPPVESHVGWVMDHRLAAKREHKTSTSSTSGKFNMSTGTTPIDDSTLMQNYRQHFQTQDLVPFHHPSYTLLKQNGFTQQLYCKFRKRCLAG